MGREIRRVPMDYVHPRKANGQLQPMFDETLADAQSEWDKNNQLWNERKDPYARPEDYEKYKSYTEWSDERPGDDVAPYYRPEWPADAVLGIQLWENTTEGTPKSPVFPDTKQGKHDLAAWAAENATVFADIRTSADDWYNMLFVDRLVKVDAGNGAIFI